MKKLNKIVLNKAKEMTAPQMKNITGGYDGDAFHLDLATRDVVHDRIYSSSREGRARAEQNKYETNTQSRQMSTHDHPPD